MEYKKNTNVPSLHDSWTTYDRKEAKLFYITDMIGTFYISSVMQSVFSLLDINSPLKHQIYPLKGWIRSHPTVGHTGSTAVCTCQTTAPCA